ncbi:MAG: hypothetical protein L0216_21350 [Planctomycetales bacterium]|nr:hypothetical protein [Planctomycetales bacterium]
MGQTTVRIAERTRASLRALARRAGTTMQAVLERAVEEARRRAFIDALNADYAAARRDRETWAMVREERAVWDATVGDGLADEPPWPAEDAKPVPRRRRRR